ncbi:MAG: GNAT family N-acetyltransferase [Candidatus Heimdallarchaeota archaeon]
MQEQKSKKIEIVKVPIWQLFKFVKLNILIHQKDPIFKRAQKNKRKKMRFFADLSYKISKQKRFYLMLDDEIAGALSLDIRKKSVFVYAVGLKEKYRRQGYGTYLMSYTEELAKKIGKQYVCFSVLLENIPAITMYNKLGYKSQGLGLTLIRFFNKHLSGFTTDIDMSLRRLTKIKDITHISTHWWLKEVEALSGNDGLILTQDDSLLDFDFKREWDIFEITTEGEPKGIVAILPTELFPTMVLFSAKDTWKLDWLKTLLLLVSGYIESRNVTKEISGKNNKKKNTYTNALTQIFLTHQHKDSLQKENKDKLFYHDITEDRQILYKKLNLNN